jgi:SAM-dependent methyltransferase
MSVHDVILRQPWVYRLWMASFAEKKFAPIAACNDIRRIQRVLDVGCGPGTNALHFADSDYLGIDLNPRYIRDAAARYGTSPRRRFLAQDAATFLAPPGERFDFVLVNSFFHHVDDDTARSILSNLSRLLTEDGHIHILDLVLPTTTSIAWFMAHADRGEFPRRLEKWRETFLEFFEQVELQPYQLGALGICLWNMVYFKGRPRRALDAVNTIVSG